LIGLEAVDGLGRVFHGGGRVVKNVAGYDVCRLLIGSCGTLGMISMITLKTIPVAERRAWIVCEARDAQDLGQLLSTANSSGIPFSIMQVVLGNYWNQLGHGGAPSEKNWQVMLAMEGRGAAVEDMLRVAGQSLSPWQLGAARAFEAQNDAWLRHASQFLKIDESQEMLAVARLLPNRLSEFCSALDQLSLRGLQVRADAGAGVLWMRVPRAQIVEFKQATIRTLRPLAAMSSGTLQWQSLSSDEPISPSARWGPSVPQTPYVERIKEVCDPQNRLNPGRFSHFGRNF
jgi:glycolate oxidase FAD binding subunit